jgi:phage shock protein C
MNAPIKRLYRSRTDHRLAGVCAGLADYLGVDPVLIRLIAVAATLMTGLIPGCLAYVAAWIIMPPEALPQYEARPAANQHG